MLLKKLALYQGSPIQINMTPMIDVVFQLIIFFMLTCQFIVAENFEVAVPDKCGFAQNKHDTSEKLVTVSVLFDKAKDNVVYAVGAEKISTSDKSELANRISAAIDAQLKISGGKDHTVCLRIDRDIQYSLSQYALAGIAQSSAKDIQMAVFSQSQPTGSF